MSSNNQYQTAKIGDTVQVDYTLKLQDGNVVDTSEGREPLEFTLGKRQVIPGFEQAVLGMKIGESKTVTIPANEAYGPYRSDMTIIISREDLPADINPEIGQKMGLTHEDGRQIIATIINVSDNDITVDTNHPLAGKDLIFEIEMKGFSNI